MASAAVSLESLGKSFGTVVALEDVSLEVEPARVFGLLGPNGAGKTTTVKSLTTLVRPDRGSARVLGHDVLQDPDKVRNQIGYIPQELTVDPFMTAREHLNFYADLYHLPPSERKGRIEEAVTLAGISGYEDRRARHFSGGMKKKLDLACGLIHRPPVIFLDEPSLGLDVPARHDLWRHILRLREHGTTIFLCTNSMDEAEYLCDEVAIIDRGKIVVRGTPEALKSELQQNMVGVELASVGRDHDQGMERLEQALSALSGVRSIERDGLRLKVYVESHENALAEIATAAAGLGISLRSISESRPGLDEVFLHHTGHGFTDQERGGV